MKRFVVFGTLAVGLLLAGCGSYSGQPDTSVSNDNSDIYVQHVPVGGKTVTCLEWNGDGISCDWANAR